MLTSIQSLTLPRFSIAAANPEGEFEMHEKLSNALSKKKISAKILSGQVLPRSFVNLSLNKTYEDLAFEASQQQC